MNNIIEIKPVERGTAKLIIGLCGQSGEGKTYSALLIALGLANGNPKKIGLIDCEGRAGLYSDIFKEPFLVGQLNAPFSPSRYVSAMKQFEDRGIGVMVVDQFSEEFEGSGGLEEISSAPKANGESRKFSDWLSAKREHKKMMNTLRYMSCHVIALFRAREKTSFKNPKEPISLGIQPIAEKSMLYDCTASFMLRNQGKDRDVIKCPECLKPILGGTGYLTEEHGKKLLAWIGGADPMERAKNQLRLAAGEGMESFKACWSGLDAPTKKSLITFKDTLKDLATHADNDRVTVMGTSSEPEALPSTSEMEQKPDIEWQ